MLPVTLIHYISFSRPSFSCPRTLVPSTSHLAPLAPLCSSCFLAQRLDESPVVEGATSTTVRVGYMHGLTVHNDCVALAQYPRASPPLVSWHPRLLVLPSRLVAHPPIPFVRSLAPHYHTLAFADWQRPVPSSHPLLRPSIPSSHALANPFSTLPSLLPVLLPTFWLILSHSHPSSCPFSPAFSHSFCASHLITQILTFSLPALNRALFFQPRYAKMRSLQRLHRHLGRPLIDPSKPAVEGSLAPSPALAPTTPKVE